MRAGSTQTLGEYLRQERERRGVTVEQVASATKISVRILHALESDQYMELPAKPFVRGFVSNYARFIGLDPKEVLTRHAPYLEEKSKERPLKEGGHSGYAFEKRENEKSRTILMAVMGTFVVLGALIIFVVKPALKHRKVKYVKKLQEAPSVKAPPKAKVEAKAKPEEKKAQGEQPKKEEVVAKKEPKKAEAPKKITLGVVPMSRWFSGQKSLEPYFVPKESDPLHKGDRIDATKIHVKVVFKTLADVKFRYQVDNKELQVLALPKDRVLVLRAEDAIQVQLSNPKSALYRIAGGRFLSLKGLEVATIDNTATMVFKRKDVALERLVFDGLSGLGTTPDPESIP